MDVAQATLQSVADRQAITDLIYRYCRAMDRIDAELGYTIWHEDGEADYGEATYQGSGRGFIDWVCASHQPMLGHSHQISNIIIDLSGDKAGSESYVTAALRFMQDDKLVQLTVRGRYIDLWSRRGDRWGIDKRVYVHDFEDLIQVTPLNMPSGARRDRSDHSYTALPAKS